MLSQTEWVNGIDCGSGRDVTLREDNGRRALEIIFLPSGEREYENLSDLDADDAQRIAQDRANGGGVCPDDGAQELFEELAE